MKPKDVLLQVEDELFRVPVNALRVSEHFRDMLDAEHTGSLGEGATDDNPIVLKGIAASEMQSFLDILFPALVIILLSAH